MNDEDAIEGLLNIEFRSHSGYVFLFDNEREELGVREFIERLGLERAQALVNHVHLNMYCDSLEEQERLAKKLHDKWTAQLKLLFPTIPLVVTASKDSGDWIVSIKNAVV